MILNARQVANVVTRPHNYIVANCYIVVKDVAFQDETIFADSRFARHQNSGADIARKGVTLLFSRREFLGPQSVHSLKTEEDKHLTLFGRNLFFDSGKRNHRAPHELFVIHEFVVDGVRDDLVRAVVTKIPCSDVGAAADSKDNDVGHACVIFPAQLFFKQVPIQTFS